MDKFKLHREYVLAADFHGNLSGAKCFLADVELMHWIRIGNALIDTIDASTNQGKEAKRTLRYIHNKHLIRPEGPGVVKTPKEFVLDAAKRKFNLQVSALEAKLKDDKPVLTCLGDFLGYYFQTREMLDFVRKNFHMVVRGNHERNLIKASMAAGLPLDILARKLGTGPYATQSTATVLSQLKKDDIEYLKSLPDEVRIRSDMVGRHCHYVGENPMYPVSEKTAKDYGYFDDPKKIKKFCIDPWDSYDRPDTFVEDKRGKVNKEFFSHSHLPGVFEVDENGEMVLDVVPGDFETPEGMKTYSIYDFEVRPDHCVEANPGSVGWSRRNDTKVRDKASEIHGSKMRMKQLYYASVVEDTIQFRERWYDINMTGTLAETLAVGMPLRKEDQEWYDNYAKGVLEAGKGGVLSATDFEWFKKYGQRILDAEPITITPEVGAA